MRKFFLVLLLAAVTCLMACSPAKQSLQLFGTDITGADFANTFQLTDHNGKPKQLSDFKGKAVVLFFGYTHCPDVCPTTMADFAAAMKLLGAKSDQVQVLFVTLDPERDTQQVLAQFVPSFDKRFLGLYGTPAQIAEAAKNFKIFYTKQQEAGKSGYSIDHSAGAYAFDKDGKIRIYLKYGQKPAELAHDIEQIL